MGQRVKLAACVRMARWACGHAEKIGSPRQEPWSVDRSPWAVDRTRPARITDHGQRITDNGQPIVASCAEGPRTAGPRPRCSPHGLLASFRPRHEFLVCLDSDGCAFDTMGIKQRECFTPWMIAQFGLQPVAQAARECKEFADLFSKTRGANRHVTIRRILAELLPAHPQVRERGFTVPQLPHYFAWVEDPRSLLSGSGLKKALVEASSPEARHEFEVVLAWSERVNWAIQEIVTGIPPFPFVRETLQALAGRADVIVVSATPGEALEREWAEHDLARYTALILGQEMGTKSQHLSVVLAHYRPGRVLMVGDAPGDREAARENGVFFYPIVPGDEVASWERLYREELPRFLSGAYTRDHEAELVDRFERALPERPPWEVDG